MLLLGTPRGLAAVLAALWAMSCLGETGLRADEPASTPQVVLKSGHVFHGKVVGSEKHGDDEFVQIDTDFGRVLVPKGEVKKESAGEVKATPAAQAEGPTFEIREVRVVSIVGTVERRPKGATEWKRLTWSDTYAGLVVNAPNALIQPGDMLRTGKESHLDFMPHKDVWIRVGPESEVEIPARRAAGSLTLLKGSTVQKLEGQPRGEVYRVATPTTVLSVRGTHFAVEVGADESVWVKEGKVQVGGPQSASKALVTAGQVGRWTTEGAIRTLQLSADDGARFGDPNVRLPPDDLAYVPRGEYAQKGLSTPLLREQDGDQNIRHVLDTFHIALLVRPEVVDGYLIDRREVTGATLRAYALMHAGEAQELSWTLTADQDRLGRSAWHVSYDTATQVAAWLGKRLPTELQWEYAARGPRSLAVPWGWSVRPTDVKQLWIGEFPFTGPWNPGPLPARAADDVDISPFGVRHMISGPPEWCRDSVQDSPFTRALPPSQRADLARRSPDERIWRGWKGSSDIRGAWPRNQPLLAPGFRCVIELPTPAAR